MNGSLAREVAVYATQVSADRPSSLGERLDGEREHLAISSRMLESMAARHRPMFADGALFGLMTADAFGPVASDGFETVVARWFCAQLNAQLKPALSVQQHAALAAEFSRLSGDFGRARLPLHARESAEAAARHFDAASMHGAADEERYRSRRRSMFADASPFVVATDVFRWLSTGFGFRPYRLVPMAVALVVGGAGLLAIGGTPWSVALGLCVNAYFGWLGSSDVEALSAFSVGVLYATSAAAIVVNSTIVALLARRWFRI